ncbi:MAG TPA: hypothetical protein VFH43_14190 [Candidatus Kapabacteria bacterium]|nr:hypothetical protein [Candidatus Kapabacteria bacterium]
MIFQKLSGSGRALPYAVGVLLILTLAFQFSSLYYFPQYDGARYWGDEFGQVIELKTELEQGYASIPTGKGATVEVTNGIVRGNSWMAAFTYGLPALIFFPSFDLVSIGRTVTAVLSIGLLAMLYWSLRKLGASMLVSMSALVVLVASRSFVFATHSARLDIAAGMAVLGWIVYVSITYKSLSAGWTPQPRWYVIFGAVTFLLVTFSIHLLTLLGPAAIYAICLIGKGERTKAYLLSAAGVVSVAALLMGTYALAGAPMTLFGDTTHHIQSHDVLDAMPAFSPFSWSVQSSNLVQRFDQFREEAPVILALFVIASIVLAMKWRGVDRHTRSLLLCSTIIIICWLQFQSSAVYYLAHITPLMILCSVMVLRQLRPRRWRMTLALGALALVILHVDDIRGAFATAKEIDDQNKSAVANVLRRLPRDGSTVLTQYPAVSRFHQTLGPRLMTTHFVNFPRDTSSTERVLHAQNVSTMLLYRTSRAHDYSFEVAPLWNVATNWDLDTVTGSFFDVGIDYFAGLHGSDTLFIATRK